MTAELQPFAAGSPLYLPASRPSDEVVTGFLVAPGVSPPGPFGLAAALGMQGWFVVAGPVHDEDVPAFVAAAQVWFASSARAGALLGWFSNAAECGAGLTGWTMFADSGGTRSVVSRTWSIELGNLALSLPTGTKVGTSADGAALVFAAAGTPMQLAVTPYGLRTPVVFPLTGSLSLDFAGDPKLAGCASFAFAAGASSFEALDMGLRSYSAPVGGGYPQTARHVPFDFTGVTTAVAGTIDPLAPLDHERSFFALPAGSTVPSFYRNPVGGAYQAAFGADFRLVLSPRLTGVDAKGNATQDGGPVYTMVPSGIVELSAPAANRAALGSGAASLAAALMGGLSAVEYFATGAAATTLTFKPGKPAFAPTLHAAGDGQDRTFGALTDAGTTAWVSLTAPSGGADYFSQPDQAVLHQGDPTASGFLTYLPLQISSLPAGSTPRFPLLPYASVVADGGLGLDDLAHFERQVWSPKRLDILRPKGARAAAFDAATNAPQAPTGTTPNPPYGTTPQGLLLQFGANAAWADLTLAMSSPAPATPRQPGAILKNVVGSLQSALQTNELFLVVSAGDQLLASSDMAYLLTKERVDLLKSKISDQACQDWLASLIANGSVAYSDVAALNAGVLPSTAPPSMQANFDIVRGYCGDFSLFTGGGEDAGWEFDLSPWRWTDHQTILIFKFCNKQLAQAAADTSQWSAARDFNASPTVTAQQIGQIIADARQRRPTDADLAFFVDTVLNDPSWNGIVALNALVPLSGLPAQMRALAAGIDPAQFKAHHVGVNVTPVQPGAHSFTASPSSIFGLIDYEDPAAPAGTDDYGFKVNSLKVRIANSQVAGFSSHVGLLITKLFGEKVGQIIGSDNTLGFDGYYQRTAKANGQLGSYQFVSAAPTAYLSTGSILHQVAITSATFVTAAGTDDDNPIVNAKFLLNGAIAFRPQRGFDLFSYGPKKLSNMVERGLAYRGLSIDMSFDEATPCYRTFRFDAGNVVFDPATSLARDASLVSHFPMKLTGLVQGLGAVTPDSLGYMPIDTPLDGIELSAPWFGLRFDLDLGTPGALAAATGFTAGMLLGWAPDSSGVYVGLSLPGVSGGQRAISLEGVLSLAFGDISFVVAPPTYLLQLSNIALKFLSLSFPPNGQIDMTLFGNPSAEASGALGWFAAYLKNGAGGGAKSPPSARG